ncbi:hypothetical protein NL676_022342 [Syzygium grande]|nr:hypothetical protein NL676_022342 [Syzygium grande]
METTDHIEWQMNKMIPRRGTGSGPRMRAVNGPGPVHKRLGSWALVKGIGGGVTSERRERLYARVLRVDMSASATSTSKSKALASEAVSKRRERLYARVLRVEVLASATSTSESEALASEAVSEALDDQSS